jgi:hypothetical protein
MAPQIFRQDDDASDKLGLGLTGPPVLMSRRQTAAVAKPHPLMPKATTLLVPPESAKVLSRSLPPVILSLPDRSAKNASRKAGAIDLPNILSWTAIIVGALIAAALIWTAPGTPPPAPDIAPAWESPVDHRAAPSSAPAWESSLGSAEASQQAPPPPDDATAPVDSERANPPAPTPGEFAADGLPRTARAPERPATENSPSGNPGESAPVGRITNVTVPQ